MQIFPSCGEGFRRLSLLAGVFAFVAWLCLLFVVYSDSHAGPLPGVVELVVPALLLGAVVVYLAVLLIRIVGWVWEGFF